MEVERPGQGLATGDGPEAKRIIGRGGRDHPPIGAECHAGDGVLVLHGWPDDPARRDLEEPHEPRKSEADRGEIPPIGAELDRRDLAGKLGEVQRPDQGPRLHRVPGRHSLPAVGDQSSTTVNKQGWGAEGGIPYEATLLTMGHRVPGGMAGVAGHRVQAGQMIEAPGGQEAAFRVERQGHHLLGMLEHGVANSRARTSQTRAILPPAMAR